MKTEDHEEEDVTARISKIFEEIRARRDEEKQQNLTEYLKKGRDQVLEDLISNGYGAPRGAIASIVDQDQTDGEVQVVRLAPAEPQNEKYTIYSPMYKSVFVPDEKIKFLPHLGDGRDVAPLLTEDDFLAREKIHKYGTMSHMEEMNRIIDHCLQEYARGSIDAWKNQSATLKILTYLADQMEVDTQYVQERLDILNEKGEPSKDEDAVSDNESTASMYSGHDRRYLEAQDSYRHVFCNRCFMFCCEDHGIAMDKPHFSTQKKRGQMMDTDGNWKPIGVNISSAIDDEEFKDQSELTTFQKTMCKRMYEIMEGNFEEMSIVLRAPARLLEKYVREQNLELLPLCTPRKSLLKAKKKSEYFAVRQYNQKWYKAIDEAKIHPLFQPCIHRGICSDTNCSCVQNHMFCTNACSWGPYSPNFFRGCACSGDCTASCTCALANRECDPDLCTCGPCCDPPGRPATAQQCRNDNITMRRYRHLLIAPSTKRGAGYGLFTRYAVKKGDFLIEYIGELISQNEGERRGQVNDARDRTYLFNLCSDYAIDAAVRGNRARFVNHSSTPNVEARMLFVKGEQRIGFFAKTNVEEQTELFIDYRMNTALETDLISKSAHHFSWMTPSAPEKEKKRPVKKRTKRN